MRAKHSIFLASLVVALTGCGGGAGSPGSATTPPSSTGTPFAVGKLQGMAAISNPPITTSSAFVVGTGLTGNFSILKLKEINPSLAETRIYFDGFTLEGKTNLYSMAIDGTDVQRYTDTTSSDYGSFVLPNGKVLFSSNRLGGVQVFSMNPDGTNAAQLFTAPVQAARITADAAGDKVSFISSSVAYVTDLGTHVTTPIASPGLGQIDYAALSPDGNRIYFTFYDGTNYFLYRESLNPAAAPQVLGPIGFPTDIAVAPDGSEIAVAVSGASHYIDRYSATIVADIKVPMPNSQDVNSLAYSPDQKQFAFGYYPGGGMPYRVGTMSIDGGPVTALTPPLVSSDAPSWSPFIKDHTLIAAGGGLLGTRACGVIYGQSTNRTTSVLAFDVTTPSSVVMTAQTPPNGTQPNLVFSIDADNITKLAYANSNAWRGIRAIGSGTTVTAANGAIVSLNAYDGTVVSILPFSGSRAIGDKPTFTDSGSTRIFTGHFLAAFDKDGKNLAPNGASSVRLDVKSGALSIEY